VEPDAQSARLIIEGVLQEKRKILNEMESKAVLSAFRIPIAQTMVAHSPNEALLIAQELGFPVALKVNSADITHKTDAGGVMLNLANAQAVREAYHQLLERVKHVMPEAKIEGISIEPMVIKPNGRELMIGVANDPVFGPVVSFGAGGTMVEVMRDRAVALPPLNSFLVKDLINGTKISKMLGSFRHMPPADMDALESVLLRVSEMVCELPELVEMDINPLIVDEQGAIAVDARVIVEYRTPGSDRYAHMAIYPYPAHLASNWQLEDGSNIMIRPIRPEDAALEQEFVRNLSENSRYFRFMNNIQQLNQAQLVGFTQIDYSRELALIAITKEQDKEIELGVARYAFNPDGESCEFAIVVADNIRGKGLGHKLMFELMAAARSKGMKIMQGDVLCNNANMLRFVESLGFTIEPHPDDIGLKSVSKLL
jgi:acetyltransferase